MSTLKHLLPAAALAVTCGLLASCAVSPLSDDWIPARPLERTTSTWRPPVLTDASPDQAPLPAPDGPRDALALRDAVALALIRSPDLASFAYDVRAAEARSVQAGLSPNPMVTVMAENLLESSQGDDRFREVTVQLSQVIELAGKRDKRLALAQAQQRLAAWDYEARRLEVATLTAQRHVAVIAAQQRVELAERMLKLAEQTHEIATQRAKAGVAPTSEQDKALVRVSVERVRLDTARHKLSAARQALASTWGQSIASFRQAVGDLDVSLPVPAVESLLTAAADHPRAARWADEVDERRRAVELARAKGVPDVTAGAGVRTFPDANDAAALLEFSIPLPLNDRNQGGVLEARYALAKTTAQSRAAEAMLHQELSAAHAEMAAAVFALRLLRDEAMPAARSAHQAARDAFATGRTDLLNVLDAERTLVEVEAQLIDARESQHTAAAKIEGLTARPLSEMGR